MISADTPTPPNSRGWISLFARPRLPSTLLRQNRILVLPKSLLLRCCVIGPFFLFSWWGVRMYNEIIRGYARKQVSVRTNRESVSAAIVKADDGGQMTTTTTTTTNTTRRHQLRLNWENISLHSNLAKRLLAHQSNCSLPMANFSYRNRYGLGSDLHVWGQALCNAMEQHVRLRTLTPWAWLDRTMCDFGQAKRSAMLCYFPKSELLCDGDNATVDNASSINMTMSRRVGFYCENIMKEITVPELRAAGVEFLFTSISRLVVDEAERQLNQVFPNGVPPNLVTVQIRWGDKDREMELLSVDDYIQGVKTLLAAKGASTDTVNVFLATEDPAAVKSFQQSCPPGWNVYVDQYCYDMLPFRVPEYNGNPKASRKTKGHAGLIALGSLLVAMEANLFVLTTASNWSRLMNELRKNIIDPRCNNCTRMVDLQYKEW